MEAQNSHLVFRECLRRSGIKDAIGLLAVILGFVLIFSLFAGIPRGC
jgi:hypothetical protein